MLAAAVLAAASVWLAPGSGGRVLRSVVRAGWPGADEGGRRELVRDVGAAGRRRQGRRDDRSAEEGPRGHTGPPGVRERRGLPGPEQAWRGVPGRAVGDAPGRHRLSRVAGGGRGPHPEGRAPDPGGGGLLRPRRRPTRPRAPRVAGG